MKKSSFLAVLGFSVVVFLPVSSAMAGQRDIPVPDAGFDDHVVNSVGGYVYIGDSSYTGAWKSDIGSGGAWIDYRYWDGDLPARSGNFKAYSSDAETFDYIYQILDETFVEGDTYTFSVWVGNAWPGEGYADGWALYFTGEDYTINLAEAHGLALSGDWEQISLVYTATAADAGKKIGIKMSGEEGESYVTFEDVTLSRESAVPLPLAYGPEPGQGEMIEATAQVLGWKPGDLAVSHNVYFGENFDDVNQATPDDDAFKGSQSELLFLAQSLTPGATYYWRIDEVNDTHPDSPWKGEVWNFHVEPATAWAPSPADGGQYVLTNPTLTWEPGMGAIFHTVHFGESFDEVNDATDSMLKTTSATHEPDPLASGTTYYWRVDEFDVTQTTHKGEVWSFTTVPEVEITDPTLVGWWTLDEGFGATAVDWSGHGNHGALMGDPQWVDGYYGGALDFSGSDHVDTGNRTDLATWTVATWVMSPEAPSGGAASGPIHREKNYQLDWNHGNEVFRGAVGMCVEGTWHAASFGALAGNTWYHLAATFDGTALTSYKNGVLIVSNTAATGTPDAEAGTLLIARHATASGNYFTGTVDDVHVYDRALTEDEIKQVMRGNPLLAGNPEPGHAATVDIRDATALRWSAGDTAASHDVYFGTDRNAVAVADNDAPEFQGNRPGTSFSLAGLVELGGGDYFWRIDEVEAAGTVQTGYVWKFTVPDYLIVDNFESYVDDVIGRIFQSWIDGWGYTEPPPGDPGNGTGATVGYIGAPFAERTIVHTGSQSMPLDYNNIIAPYYSETERTWASPQDWTPGGGDTLSLWVRGYPAPATVNETAPGTLSVTGEGADIWGASDQFTFIYKTLNGDGSLVARVVSNGEGSNTWTKGGVMIRDTLAGGSTHAMQVVTAGGGNGASFQWRPVPDDSSSNSDTADPVEPPYWVKIERLGNSLSGYLSSNGTTWTQQGTSQVILMTQPVYIGLCVTSHAAGMTRTFEFDHVQVTGAGGQWRPMEIGLTRNDPATMYIGVQDSIGTLKVEPYADSSIVSVTDWTEWLIPLSRFNGVSLNRVKKMIIGVGNRDVPTPGGHGMLFIDDIRVITPEPEL